jgi:hypothetical protein
VSNRRARAVQYSGAGQRCKKILFVLDKIAYNTVYLRLSEERNEAIFVFIFQRFLPPEQS